MTVDDKSNEVGGSDPVDVLRQVGAEFVLAGELSRVRSLLSEVPPTVLRGDPELRDVLKLMGAAGGQPEAGRLWSDEDNYAPPRTLVQLPPTRSPANRGAIELVNDVLLAASWMYEGDSRAERALVNASRKDTAVPIAQIARRSSLAYIYWRDRRRVLGQQQAEGLPSLLVAIGPNLAATYPADATVALWAAYERDRPAADEWGARAMAKLDGVGDPFPPQEVITLLLLAEVAWEFGDYGRARALSSRLAGLKAKPSIQAAVSLARHVDDLEQRLMASVDEAPTALLTDAERRTLRALDSYLTVPEIAAQLFLSPSTIRSQVKSLYRKLDVSSRTEALSVARGRGLL